MVFTNRAIVDMLTIVALVLTGLAIAASVVLFLRYRRLAIMVLALQARVQGAQGAVPKRNIFDELTWRSTTGIPTSSDQGEPFDRNLIHDISSSMLWLVGCLLLLVIGVTVRVLWNSYVSKVKIDLLVYGKEAHCVIRLMTLPGLRSLELYGINIVRNVEIQRKFGILSHVMLTWRDLHVVINGIKVMLPTKYLMWPHKVKVLSKVIKKPFATVLLVKQNNVLLGHVGHMSAAYNVPDIQMNMTCAYEGNKLNQVKEVEGDTKRGAPMLKKTRSLGDLSQG